MFAGGKVTVPKRLRELFGVEDGRLEKIMKERKKYLAETEIKDLFGFHMLL